MKKIIMLLTVITLMFTCINVSAAGTVHNVTITPSATTLSPGDTLSVEVKIDKTENICGIGYSLKFDPNVFSINTETYSDLSDTPKFVDKAWIVYNKSLSSNKTFLINNFNYTNNIDVLLANVSGFTKENSTDNMIIGKFLLTVKDSSSIGATSLSLVKATTVDDFNSLENIPETDIVSSEVTIQITEKSPDYIESLSLSDNTSGVSSPPNTKQLDTINIVSPTNKIGNLIIAAYKYADGRQILSAVTTTKVNETDYNNGVAILNANFSIPDGTNLIKTLFCTSTSEPIVKTQYLN